MALNLPNAVIFNSVPHVVVSPNHKIILLLIHNCNFTTVMDCNGNTFGDRGLLKGSLTYRENRCSVGTSIVPLSLEEASVDIHTGL